MLPSSGKIAGLFALLVLLLAPGSRHSQTDSTMYAHYINVGQAAAVLLEFPCGAALIDAGAQDDASAGDLIAYLDKFFQRRRDLNNTLALVMVTHPHIDHNKALDGVAAKYHISNYIDDGLTTGSGRANQKWMQAQTLPAGIHYEPMYYDDIIAGGNRRGKTDSVIDPINCPGSNPAITVYSGAFRQPPQDWSPRAFGNCNNHSLVVKVVFGKSSFLFSGDLETQGLETLVGTYAGTTALHADVLMVGHHGAANATTEDYLKAVAPKYAVISCGKWNYGMGDTDKFTTFYYGHPRVTTIQMLEEYITLPRPHGITAQAAEGAQSFRPIHEYKAIYCTAWDNNIIVSATTAGAYDVHTDN